MVVQVGLCILIMIVRPKNKSSSCLVLNRNKNCKRELEEIKICAQETFFFRFSYFTLFFSNVRNLYQEFFAA
jgi:hypothetical protein